MLPTSITLSAFGDAATKTPPPQAPLAAALALVAAAAHTDASNAPPYNNMIGGFYHCVHGALPPPILPTRLGP